MSQNIMFDLETLGTEPNTAILTVGMVKFDTETGIVDLESGKHIRMDLGEMLHTLGRSFTTDTLEFWIKQPGESSGALFEGDVHTVSQLKSELKEYVGYFDEVWGNGSNFDIAILENLLEVYTPWQFWNIRDVRTINKVGKEIVKYQLKEREFKGVKHHALDDAIHQAEYVCEIFAMLRNKDY